MRLVVNPVHQASQSQSVLMTVIQGGSTVMGSMELEFRPHHGDVFMVF